MQRGWQRRFPVRTRLLLGFLVLVGLFGLNAIASLLSLRSYEGDNAVVRDHLDPARTELDALRVGLFKQQISERNFIVTGTKAALADYDAGPTELDRSVNTLRGYLGPWPDITAKIQATVDAVNTWRNNTADPEIDNRARGVPSVDALNQADERFATVLEVSHQARGALYDEIDHYRTKAADGQRKVNLVLVVSGALATLAVVMLGVLLRRWLTGPLQDLGARVQTVAEGHLDEAIPITGPPELASLAADVERMRRRLLDDAASTLRSRLIVAQEEERRRIAAGIHDDSVQALTAVSLRLQRLRRRLADPEPEQAAQVRALEEATAAAIGRLRDLLFELHPPTLERDGLAAGLELCLAHTFDGTDVRWKLDAELPIEPSTPVRLLAYRLAQEAISNARRHAQARQVSVRAEPRNNGLAVTISDDGKGIDREVLSRPEAGHLGVVHTRQLAEAAGGWWSVSSAPNAGTTVVFWLPDPDLVSSAPAPASVVAGAGHGNGHGTGDARGGGAQAGAAVTPARSGPRSR